VVISDSDPQAPAFALADSCLLADVHGANETAAAAERYNRKIRKIDGVLLAADAALTFAMVTERLRLPGPPRHVAELMADRLLTRRSFASAGIAAPWQAEIFTPQELQRAAIARGRELLVKPVENRGAAGVTRLSEEADFAAAFQLARSHCSSERILVEQELEGSRFTIEGLMLNGICHVRAGTAPLLSETCGRAALALGLCDGPVVCEIVVHQSVAHVVDISPRLDSPQFLSAATKLALGENPSPDDLRGPSIR
jgi:formate-dependent phosphoribosylglycinamide formyltransferase (GAR transformylase)